MKLSPELRVTIACAWVVGLIAYPFGVTGDEPWWVHVLYFIAFVATMQWNSKLKSWLDKE